MTSSQSQDLVVSDLNSIPLTNTISFDYLRNTDVKVKVGTTESNQVQRTYNVEWTITQDKKVQLIASVFPSTGTYKVSIYRETDATVPTHLFQSGSSIRADDLNNVNKQTLFVADEVRETINSLALGSNPTGNQILLDGARIADESIDTHKLKNPAVDTNDILNGAVTNDKVNTNAAIQGTKISPNFGSQNIVTTGTITSNDITIQDQQPRLNFVDNAGSPNDPDYLFQVDGGNFVLHDSTNGADKIKVHPDGHVDIFPNCDFGAGIDVTGNSTVSGNLSVTGIVTGTPGAGNSLVPVGTVIWFAANKPPRGFLKCNNQSINNGSTAISGDYIDGTAIGTVDTSALYAVVGGTIPDIRGEFIRGWVDDRSSVDDGRSILSTQSDQMQQHNHNYTYKSSNWQGEGSPEYSNIWRGTTTNETSNVGGTDNNSENRPRNIALLACIKF